MHGYLVIECFLCPLHTCSHICSQATIDADVPVFENPPSSHAAEDIMRILLDPNIDESRVCQKCPYNMTRSATFVIDITALPHPDDIKKDDFGRWKHTGSHPVLFRVWYRQNGSVGMEQCQYSRSSTGTIYYLRRLYCTHPSNPDVKRMLAFVTGILSGKGYDVCRLHQWCVELW